MSMHLTLIDNVIVGLRSFLRLDTKVHWPALQADSAIHIARASVQQVRLL